MEGSAGSLKDGEDNGLEDRHGFDLMTNADACDQHSFTKGSGPAASSPNAK